MCVEYRLFSQAKMIGNFFIAAKFIASYSTPSPVAPSPKKLTTTRPSRRIRAASAAPSASEIVPATIGAGTENPFLGINQVHRSTPAVRAPALSAVHLGH